MPLVAVALGIVAILGVTALFLTRGSHRMFGGSGGVQETRPVRVDGTKLPRLEDGLPDAAVGARLPVLRGSSFDGRPVTIESDGHPKVVLFLAHWCPHCQRELPRLAAWLRQGGAPAGVTVHAVATGTRPDRPNYPPSEWITREGWPRPVLADDADGTAAAAVGLSAYPFFVFVDREGRVVSRRTGEIPIEELDAVLRGL